MATEAKTAIPAVDIRRVIDAPVSRVYAAWASPDAVKAWFGPGTCQVTRADFDPVVCRQFEITMDTEKYGEMKAVATIAPASAKSLATSPTRRMFSVRSSWLKPRSVQRPCRTLSPSNTYVK